MNATAWTPGPWLAEPQVVGRPPDAGCGVVASDDETAISNPSRGIVAWATRLVSRTSAETTANATLIAAAPDLYVALKEMVGRWEPDTEGADRRMWENAVAALAKAEGQL